MSAGEVAGTEAEGSHSSQWLYVLLVTVSAHILILGLQSMLSSTVYAILFFTPIPVLFGVSYVDTKRIFGTTEPTKWRSRVRRACWVGGMSCPVITTVVTSFYAVRRRERRSKTQFDWWVIVAVAAIVMIIALTINTQIGASADAGIALSFVDDVTILLFLVSWVGTVLSGYFDGRNMLQADDQSEEPGIRSRTQRLGWLVGLAVPIINVPVAMVYTLRRRDHYRNAHTQWWMVVAVAIGITVLSLVGMSLFDDPKIEDNTPAQNAAITLFFVVWPLLPLGVYYDGKRVSQVTGWPSHLWLWVVGAAAWFVNLIVCPIYIYHHHKKMTTVSDTRDKVSSLLADADQHQQKGIRKHKSGEYEQATQSFRRATEQLQEAHDFANHMLPSRLDEIEEQLEELDRQQKHTKANQLLERGDKHSARAEQLADDSSWADALEANETARDAYERALELTKTIDEQSETVEDKRKQCQARFDESAVQRMLDDTTELIAEGDQNLDDEEYDTARDRFESADEILDVAASVAEGISPSLVDAVADTQATVDQRLTDIADATKRERLNTVAADGDDEVSEARTALSDGSFTEAADACQSAIEAYESALKIAEGISSDEVERLENRLQEANKLGDTVAAAQETYETATANLESITESLDAVEASLDRDPDNETLERLDDIADRLDKTVELITELDAETLDDELSRLRDRHATLETRAKNALTTGSPSKIPRTRAIDIEYDAITKGDPIGGGGNADVYYATTDTPDGEVELAVKEPRMSGTLHTETVDRMIEEAETWQKIDDYDHIVCIVDYGADPLPWLAMEYMDAGHLGDRADEWEFDQKLWTAISVTKAVRHAHRRGIAHLDLKPENVLFRSADNGWDVPKVADWGLSKHLLEHSKSVEGLSPHYAAPEQFDDDYGAADDITDVYQLGAVFYELFTGQPPFEGQPAKVMNKVLNEEPAPPSEIADVPPALDDILLQAMATEKADRYDGVLLLRNDLQSLADSGDSS